MRCDAQGTVKLDKPFPDGKGGLIYNIPYNCGKCLNCKKNKVNQWSFRLVRDAQIADTAKFVTLTYDTENVPITKRGFMTLKKVIEKLPKLEGETKAEYRRRCQKRDEQDTSLQGFFKRLRYYEKTTKGLSKQAFEILSKGGKIENKGIKYYACGEYGSKRKRPHYHIILFNVINEESIVSAWPFGGIHIDEVNSNTIEYTLKYVMKSEVEKKRGFDGIKEFSLKSKGLGDSFLTRNMRRYHRDNLEVNYLQSEKGYKVGMPKYYRDKILNKEEKIKQVGIVKKAVEEEYDKKTAERHVMEGKVRQHQLKTSRKRDID